jgi:hypothetical protein
MPKLIDLERWPLVCIRPPSAVPDEGAELDAFYRELETVLARRRPLVVLYDLRGVRTSTARRERMIEWTSKHDAAIRTYMSALAIVVSSEEERANVTAAFWSLKQSYHARIFDSTEEAEHWLLSEFARGEGAN